MYVWIGLFETVRGSIASVHSLATAERPGIAPSKKCSKSSRLLIDGTCIVLFVQLHRASCWPNVPYDFQTRVMYIVLTQKGHLAFPQTSHHLEKHASSDLHHRHCGLLESQKLRPNQTFEQSCNP